MNTVQKHKVRTPGLKTVATALLLFSCFSLSTATAEPIAVTTTELRKQPGYESTRVYAGEVFYRRESRLGFEHRGTIERISVDRGDRVTKGQMLAVLDQQTLQANLDAAKSRVTSARAALKAQIAEIELSAMTLKRHEQLVAQGHTSAQRLDELKIAHRINRTRGALLTSQLQTAESEMQTHEVNLRKSEVLAPYDGIITERLFDEGSIIAPGQIVLALAEHSHFEAHVGFPVNVADELIPGGRFEFKVNGLLTNGKLRALLPTLDNRASTVAGVFDLEDERLYAGSLVEMQLSTWVAEPGFWIPLESLAESQRGLWSVLVVDETDAGHSVEPRLVEIIHRGSESVFVRGTLKDGDQIIASGSARVVPGQLVDLVASK